MQLPQFYFAVYPFHCRLLDLGLHAHPLIQTPPVPHAEGLHTLRWMASDTTKLTKTVKGDGQAIALRDHDSGGLIPHLPLPPSAGPFLLDTLLDSKYQILFHQPKVLLEGKPVGIFLWGLAPPWYCAEIKLPLPRFLAARGRATAARKAAEAAKKAAGKVSKAREAVEAAEQQLRRAEDLVEVAADAVEAGRDLHQARARYREQEQAALRVESAGAEDRMAKNQKRGQDRDRRIAKKLAAADERMRDAQHAADQAERHKAQADRLQRQAQQTAAYHDAEAAAHGVHAASAEGAERARALQAAAEHRAQASKQREAAALRSRESRAHAEGAQDQRKLAGDARQARQKQQRRAERVEKLKFGNQLSGRNPGGNKRQNPYEAGTGAGNASIALPSLLAHVPVPCTVKIHVDSQQLGKLWVTAGLKFVTDMFGAYVGFVHGTIEVQGKGLIKWVKNAGLGILKAVLQDFPQKWLVHDKLSIKVPLELGPAKVTMQVEQDRTTGKWAWKASVEDARARGESVQAKFKIGAEGSWSELSVDKVKAGVVSATSRPAGQNVTGVPIWSAPAAPVSYAHSVPVVNGAAP